MAENKHEVISSCIATKIAPPRCSNEQLSRQALIEQLDQGKDRVLTYVRAPVGFGKTTLFVQWRAHLLNSGVIVAWYNLDETDNEESQFISYLVASLSHAGCPLGEGAFGVYRRGDDEAKKDFVRSLINDLASHSGEVYLFLDDFHLIVDQGIRELISSILTFAPPNFHLVIGSRTEAPFSLTELRMHGQVNELIVSELAFTFDETCALLNQQSSYILTFDQIRVIFDVTEGWIAAIQLLMLSFKRGVDPKQVIDSISSLEGISEIVEYLVHDWLQRQSKELSAFFLKTSIFDRFNADLAAAVTGLSTTKKIISILESENFFVIPMEGEGQWYRYHPLLAKYLQRQFQQAETDGVLEQGTMVQLEKTSLGPDSGLSSENHKSISVADLHKKASIWFSEHGHVVESIKHALLAGEVSLALSVIESCAMDLVTKGELNTLLAWLDQLPQTEIKKRPRLRLAMIWALLLSCQLQEARAELEELEAEDVVDEVISDFEFDVVRGGLAVYSFDAKGALRIKTHWPFVGDSWNVSVAANILAFGYIYSGDIESAEDVLHWASQMDPQWDCFYPSVYRFGFLGLCLFRKGDFSNAEALFQEALRKAEHRGGRRSTPALVISGLLSSLYFETNRFREVDMLMANRFDVVIRNAYPGGVIPAYICTSRIKNLSGDTVGAREVLSGLEVSGTQSNVPSMLVMAVSERIRISLADNDLNLADSLYQKLQQDNAKYLLMEDGDNTELVYAVNIVGIKLSLAKEEYSKAHEQAEKLLSWCTRCYSLASRVELMLLSAVALNNMGDQERACQVVIEAVNLGQSAPLVRTFLDAGKDTMSLISDVLHSESTAPDCFDPEYKDRLISAMATTIAVSERQDVIQNRPKKESRLLEEELSSKELQVLKLMELGMPNKLMARSMNVTVNTIKWHLKNIYSKLGVSSRFEALARARELGLIIATLDSEKDTH